MKRGSSLSRGSGTQLPDSLDIACNTHATQHSTREKREGGKEGRGGREGGRGGRGGREGRKEGGEGGDMTDDKEQSVCSC